MNRILLAFLLACLVIPACKTSAAPVEEEPLTRPQDVPESGPEEGPDVEALLEVPEGFQRAEVMDVMATGQGHAVLLTDEERSLVLPIFIGQTEAMSIQFRLERRRYARPLTHDLLDDMVDRLGGEIVKVHVDGLKSNVFVGKVFVVTDTDVLEFDSRTSDAIALAVGNEAPIFVADAVLEEAGLTRDELEEQAEPPATPTPETPESEQL